MRLIDADKIKEELKLKELSHIIKQGEYLDYVLNEWKTRVVELGGYDPVSVVDNADTVEAIPIEWIRAYLNELKKQAEEEWEYIMNELGGYEPCYSEIYATGIKHLIEGWEKENEMR